MCPEPQRTFTTQLRLPSLVNNGWSPVPPSTVLLPWSGATIARRCRGEKQREGPRPVRRPPNARIRAENALQATAGAPRQDAGATRTRLVREEVGAIGGGVRVQRAPVGAAVHDALHQLQHRFAVEGGGRVSEAKRTARARPRARGERPRGSRALRRGGATRSRGRRAAQEAGRSCGVRKKTRKGQRARGVPLCARRAPVGRCVAGDAERGEDACRAREHVLTLRQRQNALSPHMLQLRRGCRHTTHTHLT